MKTKDTPEELKALVREKYSTIADQSYEENANSCCGAGCGCGTSDTAIMAEDYTQLPGYVSDADLGLGCGLPTEFAEIKSGDTVVDLGSGAGNDAFVARSVVGDKGKVIGIDMTERMIEKARANAEKLGLNNVEFRLGEIEKMPIGDNTADVVVSNCVLNLVPDKAKAMAETFRILKPGGHFSISDIVLEGELPDGLRKSAEMYAGCVAGAIQKDNYLAIIESAGFNSLRIQKYRKITIPDGMLEVHLERAEVEKYKTGHYGIFSITVYAIKPNGLPEKKKEPCCAPGCCDA